jgi:hypothetical protein
MTDFGPPRASFRHSPKKRSDNVASAQPLEIIIFGDMSLEDAVARAIPYLGWLAEVAPEHFLVRRVPWRMPH